MVQNLLENDIDIVMNALQQQFAIVIDDLATFGSTQGAHQSFEQVGAFVIIEQHAEFDTARKK